MENKFKWPLMQNNVARRDLDAVIEHLKQDDPKLTHGPYVREFEKNWSQWLGTEFSVMVNSGASANDLTMLILRELKGVGEVIVPGLTWVSDIASILHAGHTPVVVDISRNDLALNTDAVLAAVTERTKAIFLTHVLGFDGISDRLIKRLEELDIPLIEDVCESHGAMHGEKKLGSLGWISNFSYYYAHHMTTIEGGMISTNDPEVYNAAKMMRSHGMVREAAFDHRKTEYIEKYPDLNPDFIFAYQAHNMRPTEIGGILGLSQLPYLDDFVDQRKANFVKFLEILDPDVFQTEFKIQGNSNYAFTLILNEPNFNLRNKVEERLRRDGFEFRRGLSGGGNQLRQPYLKRLLPSQSAESLKNVDHIHHFSWYLGNYPSLKDSFYGELQRTLQDINLELN
jgi:CDP-6-deoxy-D-xylo-4-hexulose-3-dehydrase